MSFSSSYSFVPSPEGVLLTRNNLNGVAFLKKRVQRYGIFFNPASLSAKIVVRYPIRRIVIVI